MRLLLDTHALIWWLIDSSRLSEPVRHAIFDATNEKLVSAASAGRSRQALRFGTGKQLGPLLLRFQFRQQEPRESVLFLIRELGGFRKGILKHSIHILSPFTNGFYPETFIRKHHAPQVMGNQSGFGQSIQQRA